MFKLRSILVSRLALALVAACGLAALGACGQRGPLFLPKDPAAANRATLPQVLSPMRDAPGTPTRSTDIDTAPVTPITPAIPNAPAASASAPAR